MGVISVPPLTPHTHVLDCGVSLWAPCGPLNGQVNGVLYAPCTVKVCGVGVVGVWAPCVVAFDAACR